MPPLNDFDHDRLSPSPSSADSTLRRRLIPTPTTTSSPSTTQITLFDEPQRVPPSDNGTRQRTQRDGQCNNHHRSRMKSVGSLVTILAATLTASCWTGSSAEVPPGLLFANEMDAKGDSIHSIHSIHSMDSNGRPGSLGKRPSGGGGGGGVRGVDTTTPNERATTPNERATTPRRTRSGPHPIHRIYRDNASVRRRAEEAENSLPYFQTGIRGDPNHIVPYKNHPFDVLRAKRERDAAGRSLQTEDVASDGADPDGDPFRPIRIQFETSALDDERTASNGPKIEFVKNVILPRMKDFWTSALSVVPVEGNLLISTADLQGRLYCGDTEFAKVPAAHMSTGVADADLVLYVSGAPSARFCGPSTLAVAVACNFDQFDRPTAGAVNFCLDQIELDDSGGASESIIEDNVDVAVHEAAHVLGMSSNSYRFFWDPDTGEPRTPRPFTAKTVVCVDGVERTLILPADNTMKFFIATNGQRYASIVTPKVATVARNQFDCQELNGAQLENQPTGDNSCTGDHWDERMFYPESLSGVISPTTNVLSPVTLAILEDSGWYKANYTKSHVSPWGHSVGCDFVSSPCLVGGGNGRDGTLPSYSRGFFCNKASSRACSPTYTHKMACTMIDYSTRGTYLPDPQFQMFSNPSIGGPREADYCPVYGSVYSGLKAEELDCRIPDNQDAINVIYSEEYSENSMCFETTSGEGRCYRAQCIYDDFNLKLQVDGKWYTCNEDFEQIEVSTLSGAFGTTVTCPRLSSVCPDMFCPANCAGRGECVFDYVPEQGTEDGLQTNGTSSSTSVKPRPKCKCFDETDTSVGCSETFVLDGKYLRDGNSLTDQLKTNFFEPLIAVFVDHPDTWTTASWAWAAALFVVFLLMILCICSSFWPEKEKKHVSKRRRRM